MASKQHSITRRSFLGQTALGAAATPLVLSSASLAAQEKPAPSERITLGVIGTGNQGFNDMRGFLGDPRVLPEAAVADDCRRASHE